MTVEDTIERLRIERRLALRRRFAGNLLSPIEYVRLAWKVLRNDRNLTPVEWKAWREHSLQNELTPAPRTPLERELWSLARSLEDVDRDLASIPPPGVDVSPQPFAEQSPGFSHVAVFVTSDLALDCDRLVANQVHWYNSRSLMHPGLVETLAKDKRLADPSSVCRFSEGVEGPYRSKLDIRERQNHDGYMVPYGGEMPRPGRHFDLTLRLSYPMWSALRAILVSGGEGPTKGEETRHILAVPVPHPLAGRPIPIGSKEPFQEMLNLPCKELALLTVRRRKEDWQMVRESFFREGA